MNRNDDRAEELKALLLKEHSRNNSLMVVAMIESDQRLLKLLMDYLGGDDKLLAQRSATSANHYFERHPDQFLRYFNDFRRCAENPSHISVLRNFMRLLDMVDIPLESEGVIVNMAYKYLLDERMPAAIRVFSLRALTNLCLKHPSLKSELLESIDLIEDPSKALAAHIRMTKKRLLT